jgi:hypothetical protein
MKKYLKFSAIAVCAIALALSAQAAPILWVDDAVGQLGTVDVATGTVSIIGNMGVVMTDIGFDPAGNLFGMSFTNLYSINKTTAAPTLIGAHGISGGNALVFGTDGTLYGAGATTNLYTINPTTGASTLVGNMGASSAGDLAFNGGNFYLASSQLVRVNPVTGAGVVVGPFGFPSVFGLATAGNAVMYGISGTQIFSVNTATGAGTLVSNYGGQGLGNANGSSFFEEAGAEPVPEPSTLSLGILGLSGCWLALRRKRA